MFKENFERICFEKKLSPSTVCETIGLTRSAYSNWNEHSVPRKKTLEKLSEFLQVSIEELTTYDTQKALPPSRDGMQLSPFERELLSEYRQNPAFSAIVDAAFYAIHPRQTEDVSS